jgi:dihydroorotate dehydrogenase electron transfer subunit
MFQLKAKLIYNRKVADKYFHGAFFASSIAKEALPGQFVNIKINNGFEPLLRRPLSIHRIDGEIVEVLYEVVGKGTELLSQKKPREYLDVIGPLGNGFNYSASHLVHRSSILVAGGMGVAPLVFLAEKISHLPPQVLIGAKTKKHISCEKEFKDLGCSVKIATDDGSKGLRGRVTELLKSILLKTQHSKLPTLYACGPRPMLKEVSRISKEFKISAQISLEEHMACGIGACLGCAVKTINGYKRVCKEGPVFRAEEIIWK